MILRYLRTSASLLAVILLATPDISAGEIGCPQGVSSGQTVLVIGTNPNLPFYNQTLPSSPITVDAGPEWIAINPNNTVAYVTNEGAGTVTAIRISDNTILPTPFLTGLGEVERIVIKSATRAHITIEGDGDTLKAIDIDPTSSTYHRVVASAPLGCSVEGVDITLDLTRVYVTNERDGTVAVVRTSDYTEIVSPRISVGSAPEGLAINPFGTRAFVTNSGSGSVHVIGTDPQNPLTYNQVISPPSPIAVGFYPQGVAFSPCGTRAYVANFGDGTVSVIDTATFMVTPIMVGGHPYGVAAHPDNTRVYVTTDDTVAVIRTSDHHVDLYPLPGASTLLGISITPNGNLAYIANQVGFGGAPHRKLR